MDPATDRFIELATRPLADNAELHLTAAGELRRQIEESAASAEAITEAADSLARADRHLRRKWWRAALYLTTLLVSLPILVHTARQIIRFAGMPSGLLGIPVVPAKGKSDPLARIKQGLDPQQKILLFGNDAAPTDAERWKPLWDSDSKNPTFLLEYAIAYFKDFESFSPEILDAAARIDPDNAWYPVMQAAAMAKRAVKKESPGFSARKNGGMSSIAVIDEQELSKSLNLLHQASRKPLLITRQAELMRQRISLLPKRTDFASQMPRMMVLASQHSGTIFIAHLSDALAVQADRCAERKDAAGFLQLLADWKWLVSSAANGGDTFIDVLVARALCTVPLSHFRDAAITLGLEDEARRFTELNQQEEERRAVRKKSAAASAIGEMLNTKGSILSGIGIAAIGRQIKNPPSITDADLRPGRYADHALFGRILALGTWMIFGLLAGCTGIGPLRPGSLNRKLSIHLQDLFRSRDWASVILGGMVIPLAWSALIYYASPLSAREWSMKSSGFLLPGAQLIAITVLMLVTSIVIASNRVEKRAGFLSLKPRPAMPGYAAIAAAALSIPMVGTLTLIRGGLGHLLFQLGCVLAGLASLWLLAGVAGYVLDLPKFHSLRRGILARFMIPVWIFGMLVFAILGPVHYAEECHWIQQDRLLEITPEAPALSRYEWDVTQVLRKEVLEMMK